MSDLGPMEDLLNLLIARLGNRIDTETDAKEREELAVTVGVLMREKDSITKIRLGNIVQDGTTKIR